MIFFVVLSCETNHLSAVKQPFFLFILLFSFIAHSNAQKIKPADLKILQNKEDSLLVLVKDIMVDSLTAGRMRSDSHFTKTLVRALSVKNSFHYPFSEVKGIGNIYAPDSTFRIFTWQLSFDDYYSRQRGAIQYHTADGSLKLVPLWDASEFTTKPEDSLRSRDKWIGAVYYNMVQTEHNGKSYYTLFGFESHSIRSNKKWIEVLTFDSRNMPVFGGPHFIFDQDSIRRSPQHRYSIEYKKDASALINYDEDLGIILIDHLISETDEPELAYTFIPDGSYEGFKWVNGKWLHIEKVFDFKLEDGEFPVPLPLRDGQ